MMRSSLRSILVACLLPWSSWAEEPSPEEAAGEVEQPAEAPDGEVARTVRVAVGAQVVVDLQGVTRVAIGDPSIADVHVVGDGELLVTGLSHGKTSLIVWLLDGKSAVFEVEVSDSERLAEIQAAIELLGLKEEISARAVGRRIVLDGRIESVESHERYRSLVRHWPQAVDLVRFDGAILLEVARRIEEALREAGVETVEVRVVGGTLFLEGSVADQAELERVLAIAKAIHGSIDRSRIGAE